MGSGVQGFRLQGSGFRLIWSMYSRSFEPGSACVAVRGSGFRVQGAGFRGWGLGSRVQGFRVQGSGFRLTWSMYSRSFEPGSACVGGWGLGSRVQGSGLSVQSLGLGFSAQGFGEQGFRFNRWTWTSWIFLRPPDVTNATVSLCLGPYGGPRGGWQFLMS